MAARHHLGNWVTGSGVIPWRGKYSSRSERLPSTTSDKRFNIVGGKFLVPVVWITELKL